MKAIIFLETNKSILKEEYQKGKPDIIKVWKLDTFWSIGTEIKYAKFYGYREENGKLILNEDDANDSQLIKSYAGNMKLTFEKNRDYYLREYKNMNGSKFGYQLLKDEDVDMEKYRIKENAKPVKTVYTHELKLDQHGNIEIINIVKMLERNKSINKLLKKKN